MDRFVRQRILPEIGDKGQAALSGSRVLIVGCGGLASPVALYLAAAGIGKLGLIDDDRVDLSNLQRQVIFGEDDIGAFKTEAAGERLLRLNKGLSLELMKERFNTANALSVAKNYDLIVDCTDNFTAKFLINDVTLILGLPLVFGSVTGFDGQFGVFWKEKGPCYRCLYSQPPKAEVRNCADWGVLGPAVGVIGAWQALECIKVLLDRVGCASLAPSYGRITVIDFLTGTQSHYSIPRRESCVCGSVPELGKELPKESCGLKPAAGISWAEALKLEDKAFLDVREEAELQSGMIEGALHWPMSKIEKGEFPSFLGERAKWIVYCARGIRSKRAVEMFSSSLKGSFVYLKHEGSKPFPPAL